MRSHFASTSISLLALLSACQSQPSASKLAKELKAVISWGETADLSGQAWLENRVPNVYIKQTLQKSQKGLQEETKTIAEVAPAAQRETALRQVQQLQDMVTQMESMADRGDREAIARILPKLSQKDREIRTLIEQNGEKP